jgi:hypothetical protein
MESARAVMQHLQHRRLRPHLRAPLRALALVSAVLTACLPGPAAEDPPPKLSDELGNVLERAGRGEVLAGVRAWWLWEKFTPSM